MSSNSVDLTNDIEPSKENVEPFRRGKRLSKISGSLMQAPALKSAITEVDRAAHLKKIHEYHGQDPLQNWLEYIQWAEETFPSGDPKILPILEECVNKLQDLPAYSQSTKFLKVWIKYAQKVRDPESLFEYLHEKGICSRRALLYEAWATVLENKGKDPDAYSVYKMGIQLNAKPKTRLSERFEHFQQRMISRLNQATVDQDQSSVQVSSNALKSLTTSQAQHSYRGREESIQSSASVRGRNHLSSQLSSKFQIYSENDEKSIPITNNQGSRIFEASDKENSLGLSTWRSSLKAPSTRDNSSLSLPKTGESQLSIFVDPEFNESKGETSFSHRSLETSSVFQKSNRKQREIEDIQAHPLRHLQSSGKSVPQKFPSDGYSAKLINYGESSLVGAQMSFEEARAALFEDSDDMGMEEACNMEITTNWSEVLHSNEKSKHKSRKALATISEKAPKSPSIEEKHQWPHSFAEKDSNTMTLNFATETVTLNTKAAMKEVFGMWNSSPTSSSPEKVLSNDENLDCRLDPWSSVFRIDVLRDHPFSEQESFFESSKKCPHDLLSLTSQIGGHVSIGNEPFNLLLRDGDSFIIQEKNESFRYFLHVYNAHDVHHEWEFYISKCLRKRLQLSSDRYFKNICRIYKYADLSLVFVPNYPLVSLSDLILARRTTESSVPEILLVFFTIELLNILLNLQGAEIVHSSLNLCNLHIRMMPPGDALENYSQFSENHGLVLSSFTDAIDHSLLENSQKLCGESNGFEHSVTVNSLIMVCQ